MLLFIICKIKAPWAVAPLEFSPWAESRRCHIGHAEQQTCFSFAAALFLSDVELKWAVCMWILSWWLSNLLCTYRHWRCKLWTWIDELLLWWTASVDAACFYKKSEAIFLQMLFFYRWFLFPNDGSNFQWNDALNWVVQWMYSCIERMDKCFISAKKTTKLGLFCELCQKKFKKNVIWFQKSLPKVSNITLSKRSGDSFEKFHLLFLFFGKIGQFAQRKEGSNCDTKPPPVSWQCPNKIAPPPKLPP